MINEDATFKQFGYYSNNLKLQSNKKVIAVCESCNLTRVVTYQQYRNLCKSCKMKPEEVRLKLSEANKGKRCGKDNHNYGKPLSEETKHKLSKAHIGKKLSENTRQKMSEMRRGKKIHSEEYLRKLSETRQGQKHPMFGKHHSLESRQKLSATSQGIPHEKWESFVSNDPYCPKFDKACRESNRDKYNRMCFVCGLPESENTTSSGKQKKLSVHHVDMNRKQGCDGHEWKLIPVCLYCHGTLHNKEMASYIQYVLENETTA